MEYLQEELDRLLKEYPHQRELRDRLDSLASVYPFNEYEYLISHLLAANVLTLDAYVEIRDEYIARNLNLYIYEITAPRKFGESWAQGHLHALVPNLQKPSKKLDPNYSGQYDFMLGKIRIEVKASRAVDKEKDGPLYTKALSHRSKKDFLMNFQQIKPDCCDVFVWIAVWTDVIWYWVLSAREVRENEFYSVSQHRGNVGEGQLHLKRENIRDFDEYKIKPNRLEQAIRNAYKRNLA
ncbi:MAG: hypothetical protein F4227_01195 [Gammaproteobacteria bacterium]|nr:hypothetical protein [Gammaproteobacteria bacterium]MYF01624.1 hypothetical protein [Gammaproteobacteria bacterium]